MKGLVHTSTSILRSHAQFSRLLGTCRDLCKDRFLLFALSCNAPNLEQSVKELSSCANESIGCLSDPLPLKSEERLFSCSIAIFGRNSCLPFSSLETGEGPTQVGCWHTYDRKQSIPDSDAFGKLDANEIVNWAEIWNPKSSTRFIPQELENVRNANTLIYFSDNSSMGLASSLSEHLFQAKQFGVTAASTPFITGHPFTLLRNGKIQTSGAVGIALQTPPSVKVLSFDGVVRLTQPFAVTRSGGNLIHQLGDSLPARILLKAIRDQGLSDELAKNVDYYIGTRGAETDETHRSAPHLVRIVAGNPSQGSIAVEEVPAPPIGTRIEFYYRKKVSTHFDADMFLGDRSKSGVLVGAIIDDVQNSLSSMSSEGVEFRMSQCFDSTFVISSGHGFILRDSRKTSPWKCTVPGAFGGFRFL